MKEGPPCRDCGEPIEPPGRVALNYDTCLSCGSPPVRPILAIPYNKGPEMVVSRKDVKDIGR